MTEEEAIAYGRRVIDLGLNDETQAFCELAIKALEQQPRWIPVSERLPEEEGEYLISVEYKPEANYENVYTERGEWVGGQWNISGFEHCGKVENIIAWCELPLPYKAESEG